MLPCKSGGMYVRSRRMYVCMYICTYMYYTHVHIFVCTYKEETDFFPLCIQSSVGVTQRELNGEQQTVCMWEGLRDIVLVSCDVALTCAESVKNILSIGFAGVQTYIHRYMHTLQHVQY